MNIENIPLGCRACPNILPYIQNIQHLESMQMDPETRARFIEKYGALPEDVDRTDAENRLDLEESQRALSDASVRTIGCVGLRIINLDPSGRSSTGRELICQSAFEIDVPDEE